MLPNISKKVLSDLKSRLLYLLMGILIYRIGTYVPIPGIDIDILAKSFNDKDLGVLGIFNMFSGGALGRMSIFSLAIMPYITASIVIQLLTSIYKPFMELKEEGASGRSKISSYTRYLTILLCLTQGYGVVLGINSGFFSKYGQVVIIDNDIFVISSVFTLTAGTMFLMWLGEQITKNGIGNGISILIFAGIVAELPSSFVTLFDMAKTAKIDYYVLFIVILGFILFLSITVFFEKSYRMLSVNYPRVQRLQYVQNARKSSLPIKINISGVIPPIFASALLSFPATLYSFNNGNEFIEKIYSYFTPGSLVYDLFFAFLIAVFTFFYTSIVFNSKEVALNLKKSGGVLLGYRPGENTEKYLDSLITRITVIGVIYLIFICIVPQMFITKYSVPLYIGGTSLLIIVSVSMDLVTQIQSHLYSDQYQKLIKK